MHLNSNGIKQRQDRAVHGILLLNKPTGLSSNAALQKVKRLFQARKAGHTGSLDKLASGLLPICLGEATKLAGFFLELDKRYHVVCTLGVTTTTGDTEGEILQTRPVENLDFQRLESIIQTFTGPIQQIPPMYSALKHQGQALYTLARQGKTVAREARSLVIYSIVICDFTANQLTLDVHCSKGTYIRTLVEDIGTALGCGAHVKTLHRTQVGAYQTLFDFETLAQQAEQGLAQLDTLLLPMETLLNQMPTVTLQAPDVSRLRQGQLVSIPQPPTVGLVRLFAHGTPEHFFGIGHILEDGRIAPKRLFNI